ncbi:MAG: enolase C-terminal domain-like protein, partial [Sphingomicrobium sp.]
MIPRFTIREIDFFERPVRLRMPFRFGVATLTESPQAFARVRIVVQGRQSEGAAAELLAPKWFDKNPALSNEDNFEQLRNSMRKAREAYLSGGSNTAYGHSRPTAGLVENYGPALLDRALLDALCRALGISFYQAVKTNVPGIAFGGVDMPAFLSYLKPRADIAARHTVGLVDPITAADNKAAVKDGLPETLEEVIARYGHRWFKLKVGGDVKADVERLNAIAAVLDRIPEPYHASFDGNEQYEDVGGVLELWNRIKQEARLKRLAQSVVFIEQPIRRQKALAADISALAKQKPVIIDESDDSLDAFPRAKALGYKGVSSKTCKGVYKSLINAARCAEWGDGYFMSGEDLTVQAGL